MLKLGVPTGYDIKQMIDRSTRFFWGASYGQIYPELKRLKKAGLVKARQEPRGKVKRTVYSLTPKGERALTDWLTDGESVIFEIRDESLLRLFFADVLSREELLANLRSQQRLFEDVLARFREIEQEALGLVEAGPVYPLVSLRYGIEFITWARDWYADLERRVAAGEPLVELEDGQAAGRKRGRRAAG